MYSVYIVEHAYIVCTYTESGLHFVRNKFSKFCEWLVNFITCETACQIHTYAYMQIYL